MRDDIFNIENRLQTRAAGDQTPVQVGDMLPEEVVDFIDALDMPGMLLMRSTDENPVQILHANPAYCEMCGYTIDEMAGQSLSLLQGVETDTMAARTFAEHVVERGSGFVDLVNYRKDGSAYEIALVGSRLTQAQSGSAGDRNLFFAMAFLLSEADYSAPRANLSTPGLDED